MYIVGIFLLALCCAQTCTVLAQWALASAAQRLTAHGLGSDTRGTSQILLLELTKISSLYVGFGQGFGTFAASCAAELQ